MPKKKILKREWVMEIIRTLVLNKRGRSETKNWTKKKKKNQKPDLKNPMKSEGKNPLNWR
jgi:hypothetical protein